MKTIKERTIHVYGAKTFDELFAEYCFDVPIEDVISIQYRVGEHKTGECWAHYLVWYKEYNIF